MYTCLWERGHGVLCVCTSECRRHKYFYLYFCDFGPLFGVQVTTLLPIYLTILSVLSCYISLLFTYSTSLCVIEPI